ncbi:hypothetical protein [Pontibacter burrus]|uniref:DinB family protein n=1 Tax=Pontibacter burrus TaxID=2704466 RepID=A0A6B3LXG6_9BACT|nr:hypothetical protein [Pontibacter burrus]NEM98508.1 hypothetical protein [Pontibacter burrus]
MKQNLFEGLFLDSFDTFKVFHNLTAQETGRNLPAVPKTIWQILNHLIVWQEFQLNLLQSPECEVELNEQMTWNAEEFCESQDRLNKTIAKFYHQLDCMKEEISKFDLTDPNLQCKLKVVQDASVHLSFHIGEIVLMRRMTGHYPLLHQMKAFLN